jgi:hypothetical protein
MSELFFIEICRRKAVLSQLIKINPTLYDSLEIHFKAFSNEYKRGKVTNEVPKADTQKAQAFINIAI